MLSDAFVVLAQAEKPDRNCFHFANIFQDFKPGFGYDLLFEVNLKNGRCSD